MARLPIIAALMLALLATSVTAISLTIDTPSSNAVSGSTLRLYAIASESANITVGVYSGSTLVYNSTVTSSFIDVSPSISEGVYTVVFNATSTVDASTATATSSNVIIDTTDPVVSVAAPSSGAKKVISGSGAIIINYTYTEANPLNATLEIINSTSSTVASTFINTGFTAGTSTKSDAIAFPSSFGQGAYTVRVTLRDKAGRSSVATAAEVIIFDTTAPSMTISGPTSSSKDYVRGSSDITVLFRYTESNAHNITLRILHDNGTLVATSAYTLAGGTDVSDSRRITIPSSIPDGLYDINVTLYDQASQKASMLLDNVVVVDNTPPNITSFTLSATTVVVGETIAATCQATDNSDAWGGSVNTSVQNIDTSLPKTGTALCSAMDLAGNDAWATMKYTVLAAGANATNTTANASANETNSTANESNATNSTSNVTGDAADNSSTANATNTSTAVIAPLPEPAPATNATTAPQPAASAPDPVVAEPESNSGMSALLYGTIGIVVLGIVFGIMYAIGRGGGPPGAKPDAPPAQYQGPADYVPSGQKVKLSELVKKAKDSPPKNDDSSHTAHQ